MRALCAVLLLCTGCVQKPKARENAVKFETVHTPTASMDMSVLRFIDRGTVCYVVRDSYGAGVGCVREEAAK